MFHYHHADLQIQECDGILGTMEQLLGKFQNDLGTVSEEIKQLQTQSQTMSVKLKNRRAVEDHLGGFIGKMAVSNDLIDNILDSEVRIPYASRKYLLFRYSQLQYSKANVDNPSRSQVPLFLVFFSGA